LLSPRAEIAADSLGPLACRLIHKAPLAISLAAGRASATRALQCWALFLIVKEDALRRTHNSFYLGPVQLTKSIEYPHLFPPYVLYRDTVEAAQW